MSDDTSEDLSQREKRMQRHKAESRKDLPKTVAKTYGIWLVVLLVLGGGAYALYAVSQGGQACPNPHWHATFEVYIPGPNGMPTLVNLALERATNGAPYYDLSGGAGMGLAVHMHQTGAEQGSTALGPAQWHFEKDGVCVGVKSALHAVEIEASATSLKLTGAHAQVHQDGTYEANATSKLRWFVETKVAGNWTWQERTWDQVKSYQLPDGSSLLVALGNYTDAQIKEMESNIPPPISRVT
jgi:hypothetical protein